MDRPTFKFEILGLREDGLVTTHIVEARSLSLAILDFGCDNQNRDEEIGDLISARKLQAVT